jgi:thioredoxin-related protein
MRARGSNIRPGHQSHRPALLCGHRSRHGIVALLLLAVLALSVVHAGAAETRDAMSHFFNPNIGDLKADVAEAKKTGRKAILLVFEQEGCPGCLYMHRNVLNRPEVQQFYRQHFYNFAIDIHSAVPLKDFSGREFTEQGYARALGVKGTPTFAFYDLDGSEILRIFGVIKEPAEFLLLGEFVASGAYKTRKFAQFKLEKSKKGS